MLFSFLCFLFVHVCFSLVWFGFGLVFELYFNQSFSLKPIKQWACNSVAYTVFLHFQSVPEI